VTRGIVWPFPGVVQASGLCRILIATICATGCSLGISGPDASRNKSTFPVCDNTKSLVVVDGLVASALALVAIGSLSSDAADGALVAGLLGAGFAGAALHGSNKVDDCRTAIDEFQRSPLVTQTPVDDDEPRRRPMRQRPSDPDPAAPAPTPTAPTPTAPIPTAPAPVAPAPVAAAPAALVPAPAAEPAPSPPPVAPPKKAKPAPPPPGPAAEGTWKAFWREVK
jgi:hypothetical protein